MNIDVYLFQLINNLANKNTLLDHFFILLTDFSPYIILLILVWIWFFRKGDKRINKKIVLFAIFTVILAIGANYLINIFYFRPRPFTEIEGPITMLIDKAADSPSFPSNHATGAFAIAFAFFTKDKRLGSGLIILAILIAISRIFVGVHYPTDVAAGAMIAFIACLATHSLMNDKDLRSRQRSRYTS
ncbi:phosphatase PAP2 family protein [Virgibacillus alimentarius]|uniref:Undecaprenyl-diphosphatase n=1 Tax=Virgibacillus alimentarius TaxID=698769 RepID=A0ABS4SA11_9BACI|nr:phosphatase PAP2 family protein [Virgibacillus alimentarius]MBP2258333.1 undecaprenyl-diphosphatase [Virgibacillus alimentarius]